MSLTKVSYSMITGSPANVMDFGAVGDGVTDDTAAIQAALDSGVSTIVAPPNKVFLTTNTLFVTTNDTIVDFNNSKIKNKSNSNYGICLVTNAIGAKTEANLQIVRRELHYGDEIFNSHIKNVVIEMSANSGTGANLGVGIIYGKSCTIDNVVVEMSNGNGCEVCNSQDCHVARLRATPRAYGAFFFMTRDCTLTDSYIAGCSRGIVTKQSQAGQSVNFNATRCVVENLSDTFYYAVGGEFKEDTLTWPIFQTGHEIVSDVSYTNCAFRSDSDSAFCDFGYFAYNFIVQDCIFSSATDTTGLSIGSSGNPDPGDPQGKNHKIIGCVFKNATTVGNSCLGVKADTLISNNSFIGAYQRLLIVYEQYSPTVTFSNNTVVANLESTNDSANYLLTREAAATMNVLNNVFSMQIVLGTAATTNSGLVTRGSLVDGNHIRVTGATGFTHDCVGTDDGTIINNDLYFRDFDSRVYGISVSGSAVIHGNKIGNNDVVGATSVAYYSSSATTNVIGIDNNYFYGTWLYTQLTSNSYNSGLSVKTTSLSAIPTSGTWARGDVVFNSAPSAGGTPGWVCVTAGTPGTWKAMANLAP